MAVLESPFVIVSYMSSFVLTFLPLLNCSFNACPLLVQLTRLDAFVVCRPGDARLQPGVRPCVVADSLRCAVPLLSRRLSTVCFLVFNTSPLSVCLLGSVLSSFQYVSLVYFTAFI